MRRCAVIATLCVSFVVAAPRASAQDMITRLFEKATDISPFVQTAWPTSPAVDTRGSAMVGYGVEVLFALADDPKAPFTVELALGYNYLTGFKAADSALDLRGSMRTLPELSVYATYERLGPVEPYLGAHTGLLDLWHARGYTADGTQYPLGSESFQAGATAGAVWRGIWAEVSYRVRDFPSLEWELPEGFTVLPPELPRSLDLSGWNVRVGYQFSIGNDEEKKR